MKTCKKQTIVPIRSTKESKNLSRLVDAFIPLITGMISDPKVFFTRPTEIHSKQAILHLEKAKIQQSK